MRKIILTLLLCILCTNSSFAEIRVPKVTLHKSNSSSKEVETKEIEKVDKGESKPIKKNIKKETKIRSKDSNTKSNIKEVKTPKQIKDLSKKSSTVNSNSDQQIKKINIKNPFKKDNISIGEEMVSKEQIKEELKRVQDLSQQALALYNDNSLDEALSVYLKIPEKYRTAQDNLLIGNILLDLGRREDAIFMYKRAILVDEYYYKPYYNIGNICLNDDKYFMAIDYYKKAIKYGPDFSYAYYNLACAYIKTGDLKRAKSKLIKAIELKNTEPDFHYNLAYVYKKLDKPKLAQIYLDNYNKLTNGQ